MGAPSRAKKCGAAVFVTPRERCRTAERCANPYLSFLARRSLEFHEGL
jgi:hypothetical protein